MGRHWSVLVVDDEPDIHTVTEIALKRRTWRGAPFELTHAASAAEAKRILTTTPPDTFHAALVDVVMETDRAGLDLCEYIRENLPTSLRIVLRTGQPGQAPEEKVMNEYDIDFYLSKADVNEERLYAALRASFRSSLDISTSLAVTSQLREFTTALQASTTGSNELVRIMLTGLSFLEHKHNAVLTFIDSASVVLDGSPCPAILEAASTREVDLPRHAKAVALAHQTDAQSSRAVPGTQCGLDEHALVVPIRSLQGLAARQPEPGALARFARMVFGADPRGQAIVAVQGGVVAVTPGRVPTRKEAGDLARDIGLFNENWRVAAALLSVREKVVGERIVEIETAGAKGLAG